MMRLLHNPNLPWSLLPLLLLGACTGPQVTPDAPAVHAAVQTDGSDQAGPPRWDDPTAVRFLWPQEAGLAQARNLCPFLYQGQTGPGPSLVASYERVAARQAYALHVSYPGGKDSPTGLGVGCLAYDAGLYRYVGFRMKGHDGQRFQFKLKDTAEVEVTMEERVQGEDWQVVRIPLRDFKGFNIRSLKSITFAFSDALGPNDLWLSNFEFTTQ